VRLHALQEARRLGAVGLLALATAGCSRHEESTATAGPGIHTLRLPAENVTMPEGPGREAFLSACVTCHSPRYVLDQPPLPRKTWQREVDKMRTAYGAPIAPEAVPGILDYLLAVRGDGT
jgi:hypothetical protein